MKKSELRQIIKEELLKEMEYEPPMKINSVRDLLNSIKKTKTMPASLPVVIKIGNKEYKAYGAGQIDWKSFTILAK